MLGKDIPKLCLSYELLFCCKNRSVILYFDDMHSYPTGIMFAKHAHKHHPVLIDDQLYVSCHKYSKIVSGIQTYHFIIKYKKIAFPLYMSSLNAELISKLV